MARRARRRPKPDEDEDDDQIPGWEHEGTGPTTVYNQLDRYERERVVLTNRIPSELFFRLKQLAIRSTLQILTEHAYTMYLGGRIPPRLWGGYEWPDETSIGPVPSYLLGKRKQFSVRVPRSLNRWAKVFAVEAELTEQELADRVFDWYVRKGLIPPNKEDVRRNTQGQLDVGEPLLAARFEVSDFETLDLACDLLFDQYRKFGLPLEMKRAPSEGQNPGVRQRHDGGDPGPGRGTRDR